MTKKKHRRSQERWRKSDQMPPDTAPPADRQKTTEIKIPGYLLPERGLAKENRIE